MIGTLRTVARRDVAEGGLRTKDVTGTFADPPAVGSSFTLLAPSLENPDPAAIRVVVTSQVQAVMPWPWGWEFATENSIYELRLDA